MRIIAVSTLRDFWIKHKEPSNRCAPGHAFGRRWTSPRHKAGFAARTWRRAAIFDVGGNRVSADLRDPLSRPACLCPFRSGRTRTTTKSTPQPCEGRLDIRRSDQGRPPRRAQGGRGLWRRPRHPDGDRARCGHVDRSLRGQALSDRGPRSDCGHCVHDGAERPDTPRSGACHWRAWPRFGDHDAQASAHIADGAGAVLADIPTDGLRGTTRHVRPPERRWISSPRKRAPRRSALECPGPSGPGRKRINPSSTSRTRPGAGCARTDDLGHLQLDVGVDEVVIEHAARS